MQAASGGLLLLLLLSVTSGDGSRATVGPLYFTQVFHVPKNHDVEIPLKYCNYSIVDVWSQVKDILDKTERIDT